VVIFWFSLSSNNENPPCIWNTLLLVGFEVFTAVTVKSTVFWDVILCSLVEVQHFGGTYYLQIQGRRVNQTTSKKQAENQQAVPVAYLTLWPGRWKQYIHLKCWTSTGLHGITSKTAVIYNSSYLYSCMKNNYLKIYTCFRIINLNTKLLFERTIQILTFIWFL
jgi:hypothetical protein